MEYINSIITALNALEELKILLEKQPNINSCEQCTSKELLIQQIEPLEDILYHNLKKIGYYNVTEHILEV